MTEFDPQGRGNIFENADNGQRIEARLQGLENALKRLGDMRKKGFKPTDETFIAIEGYSSWFNKGNLVKGIEICAVAILRDIESISAEGRVQAQDIVNFATAEHPEAFKDRPLF